MTDKDDFDDLENFLNFDNIEKEQNTKPKTTGGFSLNNIKDRKIPNVNDLQKSLSASPKIIKTVVNENVNNNINSSSSRNTTNSNNSTNIIENTEVELTHDEQIKKSLEQAPTFIPRGTYELIIKERPELKNIVGQDKELLDTFDQIFNTDTSFGFLTKDLSEGERLKILKVLEDSLIRTNDPTVPYITGTLSYKEMLRVSLGYISETMANIDNTLNAKIDLINSKTDEHFALRQKELEENHQNRVNEILQKEEEAKKRIQEFENNSLEKISNALNTKIEASKEIMNNTILAEHLNTMEELGNHALGLTSESKQVIESTANIAQARITGSIANLNERITTELDNKKKSSMKDKVVFGMLGVIIALLGLVLFNSSNISTTSSQNTQNQGYTRSLNTQAQ